MTHQLLFRHWGLFNWTRVDWLVVAWTTALIDFTCGLRLGGKRGSCTCCCPFYSKVKYRLLSSYSVIIATSSIDFEKCLAPRGNRFAPFKRNTLRRARKQWQPQKTFPSMVFFYVLHFAARNATWKGPDRGPDLGRRRQCRWHHSIRVEMRITFPASFLKECGLAPSRTAQGSRRARHRSVTV